MFNNSLSPADLAAVTGNNNGFSGDGSWWFIIIVLALFGGFGNRGGVFGGNGGVTDGYVLASDFSNIERKIDTVNGGLCDGFYAMNSTMLNGFSNAQLERANSTASILSQMNNNAVANMQNNFALQSQLANCCCENREAIAGVNYNAATHTRDIVDAQNAGTQAILAKLCEMQTDAKDEKIADQQSKINALQLAASQAAQNNYLIGQLRPSPVPAYPVANPYAYGGYGYGYYGGTTIA